MNKTLMSSGGSIKDPGDEAENPAPMPIAGQKESSRGGPNSQGDGRGNAKQDTEGQQGSTKR
jgi:hypothetical protein